ncbi:MAG: hypothetical protein FWD15_05470 [Alphaproteobacteria bacterium]|nr:hypothetical protein [Alphaproteobacteria bacterium]
MLNKEQILASIEGGIDAALSSLPLIMWAAIGGNAVLMIVITIAWWTMIGALREKNLRDNMRKK